ncbi:hypothetical protein HDE69_002216 [Pedobacter cryoconitis]|uniref:Uncharacterized protein n=1 Tax=Pedobacter cryoconitis TaxID=188932 RepID=A0A7W8YT72_9SPHI|nr:hypothetical protein [Pedobacter cryoconitis]MBB5645525.1 hypothetical protein [Pedobacter cryoconitis]
MLLFIFRKKNVKMAIIPVNYYLSVSNTLRYGTNRRKSGLIQFKL